MRNNPIWRADALALLAAVAITGCSAASSHSAPGAPGAPALTPAAQAKADGGVMPFTKADVRFMQGMIGHHAQAVVMAAWAQTHGARSDVKILAQRIDVAQRDEIAFMQRWLTERHETVPHADVAGEHAMMDMPDMLMPGMLTAQQMAQLDKATGTEFDRLFLTFMMQHHQGALTMVDTLFASPGGGQELYVFRFASDVGADQTTEIDRMRTMLAVTQP
jgi:uncharacterized protein (DUF305 family)